MAWNINGRWVARLLSGAVFALAIILLYISLRGMQWKIVFQTIVSTQPVYAALAAGVGVLPLFLRAARWRILLQAEARVSYITTFWAVAAGYFGNNFLPARSGEWIRSYIVQRNSDLRLSYVLATALSERVADAIALVVIGAGALRFIEAGNPALTPKWIDGAFRSLLATGVIGFAGLACLPLLETQFERMLHGVPRIQGVVQQILLGVRSLHSKLRLTQFMGLTLAIWLLDAIATSLLAKALSISMPLWLSTLLIVALSLASALPSAPGYAGVYQFVAVTVLTPFNISRPAAIAFILVTQAVSYIITGIPGILAITRYTPISWRAFRRPLQPIHIQS